MLVSTVAGKLFLLSAAALALLAEVCGGGLNLPALLPPWGEYSGVMQDLFSFSLLKDKSNAPKLGNTGADVA